MNHIAIAAAIALAAGVAAGQDIPIPKNRAAQIERAAPAKPRVAPRKARRVLIWNTPSRLLAKDPHKGYCTPYGCQAMKTLGTKTGAYTPVASDDVTVFLPDSLKQFDAVILNNACGSWITPSPEALAKLGAGAEPKSAEKTLAKSILDWVQAGGGMVAYHYALGANRDWAEFGELFGARIAGHPWNEEVGVKVEEPTHPLVAAFEGKGFRIAEEVFQYREPWDRTKCRVLLSLDNDVTNMNPKNYTIRKDRDFALAWVKTYGKGRVFYTSFGHRTELYWNPQMLQFYLDGIQFACGDLEAPTDSRPAGACEPSRAPKPAPQTGPAGPIPAALAALSLAQTEERKFILDPRGRKLPVPTAEELKKIEQAAPAAAPAKPAKGRKVLIYGKLNTHQPTPFAAPAIQILGRKSGAFESVISDDPNLLLPEAIKQFDAVLANNWHEKEPFLPANFKALSPQRQTAARAVEAAAKKSLLDFVERGGGFAGVHAATAACRDWPEYGRLIGAFHAGQTGGKVPIRNEQPDHPVNACFGGKDWAFSDEIYLFREPYSRANLRVLLSLDVPRLKQAGKDPAKRPDGDYAVSWVRRQGKGRVFYCSLGHMPQGYWDATFLAHMLAGIQWAVGDLPGPGEPLGQGK